MIIVKRPAIGRFTFMIFENEKITLKLDAYDHPNGTFVLWRVDLYTSMPSNDFTIYYNDRNIRSLKKNENHNNAVFSAEPSDSYNIQVPYYVFTEEFYLDFRPKKQVLHTDYHRVIRADFTEVNNAGKARK